VPASENLELFRDHTLALVADLVNLGTLPAVPVTVLTGGQWVSGELIAGRARFDEAAQHVVATMDPLASALRAAGASLYPSRAELEALLPPAALHDHGYFLHLRDARLVAHNAEPVPESGTLLRLRLDEVAGWSLGQLRASNSHR
jgi:hypothetical protein